MKKFLAVVFFVSMAFFCHANYVTYIFCGFVPDGYGNVQAWLNGLPVVYGSGVFYSSINGGSVTEVEGGHIYWGYIGSVFFETGWSSYVTCEKDGEIFICDPAPPAPPDQTKPDSNADTVEPINFISGNNYFSVDDFKIATPGIPLVFSRYYNSSETNSSILGAGWRHSYAWSLSTASNRTQITDSDARTYTFAGGGSGMYSASFENNWQLTGLTNGEHILTLPGHIAYRFDVAGVLQSISDGWSNQVSMVYSNGRLVSAQHSNGAALDFSYSNGLLSAVSSSTNLTVSFSYNAEGLLSTVVRDQNTETYSYDSSTMLTQRVNVAGSDYHYSYDGSSHNATGMYLTTNHWYEHAVEYTSSSNRSVTYYRNGESLSHSYVIDPGVSRVKEDNMGSSAEKILYVHDLRGNLFKETTYDADTNRWTQVYRLYDDWHNVTNEAFGLSATPTNITRYTWDTNGQVLTSVTDPEGFRQEYEYTNGVISLSRIYLSSNETAETTYSYTTNGLLSVITNANGHTTSFTYDSLGYPQTVAPQAGPTVTFGYDTLGHLTNSALPGGRETQYTVNPLGWVQQIDYADLNYETFEYNGLGDVTNHVDRAGRTTRYEYLPGGKLTAVTRQFGETNVTVSYDFDQQFNTLNIKDELGRPVESYVLDPLDRPTTVTNVEGQTMSIHYLVGDFVDSITRFDGTVVSNEYTGDGHLKAVHYPDETNQFTYLRNGLFQTLENSTGMISNDWNSAGWLVSQKSEIGNLQSAISNSYDLVGNVTNSSVSLQSAIINQQYAYDEAERVAEISQSGSGILPLAFSYYYNADNSLVSSVSNANIRASYQYDIMDRITSIDWINSSGATILSFDYQYNAVGIITNRIIGGSSSTSTAYQYDDLDRLISVDEASSLVEYTYDEVGNRLTKSGGDFTVSYSLGDGNRLASWSATSTNEFESFRTLEVRGSSSEPIGTDDRWGQLWVSNSVAVTPDVSGTNFSIDAFTVGMGTQIVVAAIRDQAGNMGYATNEVFVTVVTNAQYGYSVAGCLTNISYSGEQYANSKVLEWNSQYQLTSVTSVTSVVNYSYDVIGRRISRTETLNAEPGTTNFEYYVYDGNQVVADIDGEGNLLRSYIWGTGIDNLLALTTYGEQTNTYYALKDHLNSVHAFIDESGDIVESYSYDAWGRTTIYDAAGNELAESAIGNRYCFQGREIDWETGLYYFRARWYDPVVGHWLSKDPIGISGGLNLYAFCFNNPVNATDPSGLQTVLLTPWWAALLEEPPVAPRPMLEQVTPKPKLPASWKPSDPVPEGFEPPTSPKGNWSAKSPKESLRDDMGHEPGIKPHWDYKDPSGKWWRIYEDGSREPKSVPGATKKCPDMA